MLNITPKIYLKGRDRGQGLPRGCSCLLLILPEAQRNSLAGEQANMPATTLAGAMGMPQPLGPGAAPAFCLSCRRPNVIAWRGHTNTWPATTLAGAMGMPQPLGPGAAPAFCLSYRRAGNLGRRYGYVAFWKAHSTKMQRNPVPKGQNAQKSRPRRPKCNEIQAQKAKMKGIAAQKAKMKGTQGPKDQNERNKPPGGEARASKLSWV